MDATQFLATFWGSLLMILGGLSAGAGFLRRVIAYTEDKTITIVTGYLTFLLGLGTVAAHNVWVWDWPVFITLLGWATLMKGITKIAFPQAIHAQAQLFKPHASVWGVVIFLIGAFVFWIGLHA